jgi:hypothetical protein
MARGATLLEVLAICLALAVLLALVPFAIPSLGRARPGGAQQLPGALRVRSIHQGLVAFAQDNGDLFPLPSRLDLLNATVADRGDAKNTSANIASILLWNQLVNPDTLVDTEEKGNVAVDANYQFTDPIAAVDPTRALWDPAFNADFTRSAPGNLSWAHLQPAAGRLSRWNSLGLSSTFDRAVVSTRGAEIRALSGYPRAPTEEWVTTRSHHLKREYRRARWEGFAVFDAGYVSFLHSPYGTEQSVGVDALFLDEPNDSLGVNDYLSIFTTAGEERRDFTAIWD